MRPYQTLIACCVLPLLIIEISVRAEETPAALAERLVKALGADSFEDRNTAEKKLSELGLVAKAALEQGSKSDDAEVRVRVARLMVHIFDADAREHEAAWIEKIGPGFGAAKLNAIAGDAPQEGAEKDDGEKKEAPAAVGGIVLGPVDLGLEWLAGAQEPDGHWDSQKYGAQLDGDLIQTGWALLAFLGAGHTEKVGQYKQNVRRAVAWLSEHQRDDGAIVKSGWAVDGVTHAVCALALAEAAGMARIPGTVSVAQMATDYSCNVHQSRDEIGKTGFGRAWNSRAPELFTTTLFVLSLKSAKVAGLKVEHDSFDGVIKFLDRLEDRETHTFRIKAGGEASPKGAFMGCLCRQFLGWKKEDLTEIAEAGIKGCGLPTTGKATSDNFIAYIGNLSVFQQGGVLWKTWNEAMKKELTGAQAKEDIKRGSWAPAGVWGGAGRVLSTAFNTLDLEVYYRYKQLSP